MSRNTTPRILLTAAVSGALVLGLAACGGDDDDAATATVPGGVTLPTGVTIPELPEVTIPSGVSVPDISDITLPGGVTIPDMPDISIPDMTDVTMPGGLSLDDITNMTAPDFSGEGSEAFCAAVERMEEFDSQFDGDSSPAEIEAALPEVMDLYRQISDAAPGEISGYVDQLVDAMNSMGRELAENGYDEDAIDPATFMTPEMFEASMAIGQYTQEFCQIDFLG